MWGSPLVFRKELANALLFPFHSVVIVLPLTHTHTHQRHTHTHTHAHSINIPSQLSPPLHGSRLN